MTICNRVDIGDSTQLATVPGSGTRGNFDGLLHFEKAKELLVNDDGVFNEYSTVQAAAGHVPQNPFQRYDRITRDHAI